MSAHPALTDEERSIYEWQLWVAGFGEAGQLRLRGATALVTRIGGVGGAVAMHLSAAGVGRLILAHAGNLRLSDLNRQLLMSHAGLGKPRVEQAAERLRAFNPHVEIVAVGENIGEANVDRLVQEADIVASCAPLFEERLLLNRAAVAQKKPLVDAAMYEMEAQLTTVLPGRGPCLACLYPAPPAGWNRRFPVFGAVAGTVGSLAAVEVIKVLSGIGEPLVGKLLICDLAQMSFRKVELQGNPACAICGQLAPTSLS
ncbi:MAG: HesA/MoeB/ThiF family protein [Planctomycetes bacterium]|nr:HesA/MoeB/ThiF family protein [Planctomycetota bacterium]